MFDVCWIVALVLILAKLLFDATIAWVIIAAFFFAPLLITLVVLIVGGIWVFLVSRS